MGMLKQGYNITYLNITLRKLGSGGYGGRKIKAQGAQGGKKVLGQVTT